ncbi:DUF2306 domain-containing protein [Pseudonocardia spinosispora]|uniref:DUF2306 domain-containing protein n=1 Tax=Pseudonocardia spinosispora TaxID=103441 RepID=UPI000404CBEE|nr:DUF2306 domain-containing protein [Pseudonocardia spinosispora]
MRTRNATYWWRRPWIAPLLVLVVLFLVVSLPRYLTLDPAQSLVPPRPGYPPHYALLVGHIFFGSVALLTCCLQVWPWLRRHFPLLHRLAGRAYFFLGVFPAAVLVLGVAPVSSSGFVSSIGNTLLAVLWLYTSVRGYRTARRRRYAEHRRWMIRSFALTTSIVANRVWLFACLAVAETQLDTTYGGNETAMIQAAAGASVWLSWVVNILVAEWWLERTRVSARPAPELTGSRT